MVHIYAVVLHKITGIEEKTIIFYLDVKPPNIFLVFLVRLKKRHHRYAEIKAINDKCDHPDQTIRIFEPFEHIFTKVNSVNFLKISLNYGKVLHFSIGQNVSHSRKRK